jgi:predicted RNA-binding protein (virulence factor B family)
MVKLIGDAAGKVWEYLDKNGPSSVTKLTTETGISKNEIQRAIGWLAKEDKIFFDAKGRTETVSLK